MDIHREEAGEESAPYLCLRQLSKDVNIRLSEPLTGDGSSSASVPTNMFCVASSQRLAAASTRNGINIYDLNALRNTFIQAERNASPSPPVLCTLPRQPGTGDVLFVMFGNSDSLLVAATSHGFILIWDTLSLRSSPPAPRTVAPPRNDASRVHMMAPNPGDKSVLCAIVYGMDLLSHENGSAHILDLLKGEWVNTLPAQNVTSVSWSARGKQLVIGVKMGEIIQYTPEGDVKAVLPPPESDRPVYVEDVQWLENHVFLITYNTCSSTPEPEPIHENEVYVLHRDPKSNSLTFAAFPYDVSPPFGDRTRWGYRYTCMLRDWSPMKHFVFMTCSASTDVGVLGFKNGWKALVLEETSRPVLPFLSGDEFCDSSPVALALDLTAEDPVSDPNAAEKGEDPSATLPATPILYIYTNDGVLLGYHVIYTETDKPYPGMINGQAVVPHSSNASTKAPASVPPAFAESVHGCTAPNITPAFGSTSAFGAVSQPAFGSTSAFGAVSQPAFGSTSAFGQPSSFGSTFSNGSAFSKFSASGAATFGGRDALGQKQTSASGQSIQPSSGLASGQSSEPAFGSISAFGQLEKPTFGTASTFARAQKPMTGTNSAFGQFSQQGSTSGFGSTAFSALSNKQNAFGSVSSQGSVFGSGGSFDTGKPAFASVTPAPKALPKSEEPVNEDAPKDATFSFGGLSDMLSKSSTPMSTQQSANLNPSHQAKVPSEINQSSASLKTTTSALSESSDKPAQNDSDDLEKAEGQNFENSESATVDTKQDEAHERNFAFTHDTPAGQKSEQADKVIFESFKGKQENQLSSFDETCKGIKETGISPTKAAANKPEASPSTLVKPSEEKPKESAFSFSKPTEEKPKESAFSFAKPSEEKPKESAFSFSKPTEEKPKESAFSFAKPSEEKPKEPSFSFSKPSEEKLEKKNPVESEVEFFSHGPSSGRQIDSQKLAKDSEFDTYHATETTSNALVDNELSAVGVSLTETVPQIDLTQVADPNVPKEDDELKQEFVKIYAILEEELCTLRKQTKRSTDFFKRLKIPSTIPKSVADLPKADSWVFGDIQSLSSLTSELLQLVTESEAQVAETRKRIASIESVQLKTEVKREEIARFLRARQDPDFAKMVRVRHLGPEQLENQARLRRSSHLVRERLSELGEYFNGLQKFALNAKQGQTTLRAPTLDTIYRSADNIGRLVSARIGELDKMGQAVDAIVPRSTVRAHTPYSPARPLDNMADLDTALPEVSDTTGVDQAGMMHVICDAIWKSKKTPVVTRASQTNSISSVPYQMSPIVLHCSQTPTYQVAPVQESDKGKKSETLVKTEPSTKNFLATATPSGIHVHSPMQPRQNVTSAFQRLSTLPTLTSHSNPTSSAQYTTFEGLVGPQPTASSEPRDLTLEEFIAQDEEDHGDYTGDESYEDYDDDDDDDLDDEEEEEANASDAS